MKKLLNPLKLTDNITVKFYGDVFSSSQQCSILGGEFWDFKSEAELQLESKIMESNDCLLIGGFFWSTTISKWAVVIGYLLGFRFSTKDEIKTAKKNKEKIIEVWNLLVDKYSDGENIWEFLKNLKEGEDFESIKTNIEMNFSAPKIAKYKEKKRIEDKLDKIKSDAGVEEDQKRRYQEYLDSLKKKKEQAERAIE